MRAKVISNGHVLAGLAAANLVSSIVCICEAACLGPRSDH